MSSKSVRVGAVLFKEAQKEGAVMSRSAAQQIECWARLGAALEAAGLSVAEAARMLRSAEQRKSVQVASEDELWELKRKQQRQDVESIQSGRQSAASMSWFSNGRARKVKLVDSPY